MQNWLPLVSGALADEATAAIDAIAADMAEPEMQFGLSRQYPLSLGFGRAGVALFQTYLGACRDDEESIARAAECLGDSLQGLSEAIMLPDLYRGFAGIAWTFEHVKERLWGPLEDDPCQEVDDALAAWVREGSAPSELMHGLAGICIYALERLSQPSARELAGLAVAGIEERSRGPRGWGWPLPTEAAGHLMGVYERERPPGFQEILADLRRLSPAEGVIRPGAAHGVSGVLAALGAVHARGVAT
ncbi:MAG: lanthionine synthetase LanC family protein, partial [Thermoanaerobaculia bacterium]